MAVDHQPAQDLEEPGPDAAVIAQGGEGLQRAQVRLLNQILCGRGVPGEAHSKPEQRLEIGKCGRLEDGVWRPETHVVLAHPRLGPSFGRQDSGASRGASHFGRDLHNRMTGKASLLFLVPGARTNRVSSIQRAGPPGCGSAPRQRASLRCLPEPNGHDQARDKRHSSDQPDGISHAEPIRRDTGQESAHGIAEIPPEPVDADRGCPPDGMRDIRRSPRAASDRPWPCRRPEGHCRPRSLEASRRPPRARCPRLDPHARRDQPFAPESVGEGARYQLTEAPHGRIDRRKRADLSEAQPGRGEQQREQSPRHAVVQVVDEAGLADGRQSRGRAAKYARRSARCERCLRARRRRCPPRAARGACVSRTTKAERSSPASTKPMPREKGHGRRP